MSKTKIHNKYAILLYFSGRNQSGANKNNESEKAFASSVLQIIYLFEYFDDVK